MASLRCAVNTRDDVVRNNFSFARRMLRGRWTIAAGRAIRHERAIAQRPETVDAFDFEVRIHFNPAAFFRAGTRSRPGSARRPRSRAALN